MPAFARELAALGDLVRQRRVRNRASRARIDRRHRAALCPRPPAFLMEAELEALAEAHSNDPEETVRLRDRRREGAKTRSACSSTCIDRVERVRRSAAAWRTRFSRRRTIDVGKSLQRRRSRVRRGTSSKSRTRSKKTFRCTCRPTPSFPPAFGDDHNATTVPRSPTSSDRDDPRYRTRDERACLRGRVARRRRRSSSTARWASTKNPRTKTGRERSANAIADATRSGRHERRRRRRRGGGGARARLR